MAITLFGISVAFGFLFSGFLLWKRAVEEHLPEDQVFDVYVGSALWALLAARATSVFIRFDQFGLDPLRWLAIFSLPGLNGPAALVVGVAMILFASLKRHWDPWMSLDVFLPAVMAWQVAAVAVEWWPLAILWLGWVGLLWWIEREYRLWDWYRGRRGSAKPGLVAASWAIGVGAGVCLVALLTGSVVSLTAVGAAIILTGMVVGYRRSGRLIAADITDLRGKMIGLIQRRWKTVMPANTPKR